MSYCSDCRLYREKTKAELFDNGKNGEWIGVCMKYDVGRNPDTKKCDKIVLAELVK